MHALPSPGLCPLTPLGDFRLPEPKPLSFALSRGFLAKCHWFHGRSWVVPWIPRKRQVAVETERWNTCLHESRHSDILRRSSREIPAASLARPCSATLSTRRTVGTSSFGGPRLEEGEQWRIQGVGGSGRPFPIGLSIFSVSWFFFRVKCV